MLYYQVLFRYQDSYLKFSPAGFINGNLMCHTPTDKWYPKMWHEEHHEQNSIDVVIKFLRGTQDQDAFIANCEDHDRGYYVEGDGVHGCSGLPAECDCT